MGERFDPVRSKYRPTGRGRLALARWRWTLLNSKAVQLIARYVHDIYG